MMEQDENKKSTSSLKKVFMITAEVVNRYLNHRSTRTEKEVLDKLDLTGMEGLWRVPKNKALTHKQLKTFQTEVYNLVAHKQGMPHTDWDKVKSTPVVRNTRSRQDIRFTGHRANKSVLWVRTAASVAAVALVLIVVLWGVMQTTTQTYVAEGATKSVFLPDSSLVVLNKGSRLRVSPLFNRRNRKVEIAGEGFFKVTPNRSKPFIIEHGDLRSEVLGTSFTIRNYRELSHNVVIVNSGKVQVVGDNMEPVLLTRNMQLAFDTKAGTYAVDLIDADTYSQWTVGHIVLRGADLQELALRIKQLYGKKLRVNNRAFGADVSIDAEFDQHVSVEEMMESFKLIYGFTYRITDSTIEVY